MNEYHCPKCKRLIGKGYVLFLERECRYCKGIVTVTTKQEVTFRPRPLTKDSQKP